MHLTKRRPLCNFRLSTVLVMFFTFTFQILEADAETDYQWTARSLHNKFRWKHFAKPLQSNEELHRRAVKCAEYYVELDSIDHSCPYVLGAGENIHGNWGGRPSNKKIVNRSINNWYAEESLYTYDGGRGGGRQRGTGHFTQMVWKASRQFGCGIARKGHMTAVVTLYYPPGNYIGEYNKNVWRPSDR